MVMVGYNLAAHALSLHEQNYATQISKVEEQFAQVEQWTDQLNHITNLLAEINNAKKRGDSVLDFSGIQNPETGNLLVDDVRAISPHLIPDAIYTWKKDEVDLLIDSLNNQAKGIATRINPTTMRANQGLQDIGELVKVFHDIIKLARDEVQYYVRHQKL